MTTEVIRGRRSPSAEDLNKVLKRAQKRGIILTPVQWLALIAGVDQSVAYRWTKGQVRCPPAAYELAQLHAWMHRKYRLVPKK